MTTPEERFEVFRTAYFNSLENDANHTLSWHLKAAYLAATEDAARIAKGFIKHTNPDYKDCIDNHSERIAEAIRGKWDDYSIPMPKRCVQIHGGLTLHP